MNPTRRCLTCLTLVLLTIPVGLAIRMMKLGLPYGITKYGGSILWAVALYWLIAACLPRLMPVALGLVAALVSAAIEFSRLWHTAATDAFRLTLAGRLLLGRFFSLKDVVAYWLAIALTAWLDQRFNPSRPSKTSTASQ